MKPLVLVILILSSSILQAKSKPQKFPNIIQNEIKEHYKDIDEKHIQTLLRDLAEQPALLATYPQKNIKAVEKEVRAWLKAARADVLYHSKDLYILEYYGVDIMRNPSLAKSQYFWAYQDKSWVQIRSANGKIWIFDIDQNGRKDFVILEGCCGHGEITLMLNPTASNLETSDRFSWAEMANPKKPTETYSYDSMAPKACDKFLVTLKSHSDPKKKRKIKFDCKDRTLFTPDGS